MGGGMTRRHFSSKDFAAVPASIATVLPERLIHPDVLGNTSETETAFSAERRHLVRIVDLPSKVMSMTIGGLDPGQETRLHRHNYETLIYILEGSGKSEIGYAEVPWKAGDAIYIPAWAWHRHHNDSATQRARYVACENAPQLQNLGIAVREEG
jgi:quercetin dioxygenase-like cupin family protein